MTSSDTELAPRLQRSASGDDRACCESEAGQVEKETVEIQIILRTARVLAPFR